MDLDVVERERGGPLSVRERGRVVELPSARDLPWRTVAMAATDAHAFVAFVWPAGESITAWKIDLAQRRWCEHNGLPDRALVGWLTSMLDRHYEAIEYDLRVRNVSAGDLFRDRRWRELAVYIQGLPGDSKFSEALMNDEEYLESTLSREKDDGRPRGPKLSEWSLTNALLTKLIEEVRRNTAMTQAAAGGKPQPIQAELRPQTMADSVRRRLEKQRHDSMVAVLLRDRPGNMAGSPSPSE